MAWANIVGVAWADNTEKHGRTHFYCNRKNGKSVVFSVKRKVGKAKEREKKWYFTKRDVETLVGLCFCLSFVDVLNSKVHDYFSVSVYVIIACVTDRNLLSLVKVAIVNM